MNQIIGYHIFEAFNSVQYKIAFKYYDNFNISELPKRNDIRNFDYEDYYQSDIKDEPYIFIRKRKESKGLILKISTYLGEENEETVHNEMIIYLYSKKVFSIIENTILTYNELLKKNTVDLSLGIGKKLIMKSNLDYFTILSPYIAKVNSKAYLFNSQYDSYFFEFPVVENAFIELYFADTQIGQLATPNLLRLCVDDISREYYIYFPYMTNFNILYGDMEIYDMNITLLDSLDNFYNKYYMKKYNFEERYYDFSSLKNEQFFYKLKCKKESLVKIEDAFIPVADENIIFNTNSTKIILDFSQYDRKQITFQSNLSIYIGFLNSPKLDEDCILNFSINNDNYSINSKNPTFFQKVKCGDILKIEKPNKDVYTYINAIYNYTIEELRPITTKSSGIFVFKKNVSEEYDVLISISSKYLKTNSKFSLFYGNLENYEYNSLFKDTFEMSNNPYKYLEEYNENKYFFIIYQGYNDDELKIAKLREMELNLNELSLVEKYDNEDMKLKLPKFNEEMVYAFIQNFNESIDIYNDNNRLEVKDYGKNFKIYIFNKEINPFGNNGNTLPYKSFFYISYLNYTDDINIREIPYDCEFSIKKISDSYNEIVIDYNTICTSTIYNYFIFIDYNNSFSQDYEPIKLFYEKDINKDIKYYEVQKKGINSFKISDSFLKGDINITIVGQDTEGFNRIIYTRTSYYYSGKKESDSSSHALAITLIVVGSLCLIVIIIFFFVRSLRRKKMNKELNGLKSEKFCNKKKEEINPDFMAYM